MKYAGSSGYYYADPEGRPFVCWANEDQSATSQDRPDTTIKDINGDVIQIEGDLSDNSTNIDLSGMTITLPDGKVLIADNIIYDESNLNDCSYYYVVFSVIVDGDIYSVSGVVMGNDDDYDSWYDSYKVVDVPGGYIRFSNDYAYLQVDPSGSGVNIQGYELWKSAEYTSVSVARAASDEYAASNKLSCELITSIVGMDPAQMRTPTLAVRTDLDITSYQIGGVRPSLPTKGQVWALVEGDRITSIQIYNGSAWEGCDGRIWTGERWVPASSYNIITLQDMYDIVDATPNYEYIYTESGFWAWWQKAWIAFTDKLFSSLGTGSGGSGGSTAPTSVKQALAAALSALIESLFAVITTVLQSLLVLVTDMLSFFFNFLTDTVLGGISNFFSAFTDGSLTEWFQQTGEDGSTTVVLQQLKSAEIISQRLCQVFFSIVQILLDIRPRRNDPAGHGAHSICSSQKLSSTRYPISPGAATGNLAMLTLSKMGHIRFSGSSRRDGFPSDRSLMAFFAFGI